MFNSFPFISWNLDREKIDERNKKILGSLYENLKNLKEKKEKALLDKNMRSFEFIIRKIIQLEDEIAKEIDRQRPIIARW